MTPTFAQWLKEQRKARDLTQKRLADKIGYSSRTIEKVEIGDRRPSRQLVVLLAGFFGIPESERAAFMEFARREMVKQAGDEPDMPDYGLEAPWRAGLERAGGSPGNLPAETTRFNNLPAQHSQFVGRERDARNLLETISSTARRLVTITGPPGVGKTRLALHVSRLYFDTRDSDVCLVPLSTITDPERVAGAIGEALAIKYADDESPTAALTRQLKDRQLLLLLDNFEQVVSAGPCIAELVEALPSLKVLVTSRALLHLTNEHEFPLATMSVPPPGASGQPVTREDLEEIARYDSVQLFIQRADAASPGFTLDEDNAWAIAGICRRLEGLPLVLELAAVRTRLLSPQAILQRLESRLGLLTGGHRDLPARQQTLRGAIEWSYDLLAPPERVLFHRLAVFVGGCTLRAIEATCNWGLPPESNLLDLVASLVDKSLLQRQATGTTSHDQPSEEGDFRFAMLETICEYALERLEESGEENEMRRRHALFYLALAEQAEDGMRGPEQSPWLARLERERDNLRAAVRWCGSGEGDPEVGLRIAAALMWYWMAQGYIAEGREVLSALLQSGSNYVTANTRAKASRAAATLAMVVGDYSQARTGYAQAVTLWRESGYRVGLARALLGESMVAGRQGDHEAAKMLCDEGLTIARGVGNDQLIAMGLFALGQVLLNLGRYERARACFEECLPLLRAASNDWSIAQATGNLGLLDLREEKYDRARDLLAQALGMWRDLGVKERIGEALLDLARIASATGDFEAAARLLGAVDALRAPAGPGSRKGSSAQTGSTGSYAYAPPDLGPEWEPCREAGRRMGMQEAIDVALRWAAGR